MQWKREKKKPKLLLLYCVSSEEQHNNKRFDSLATLCLIEGKFLIATAMQPTVAGVSKGKFSGHNFRLKFRQSLVLSVIDTRR